MINSLTALGYGIIGFAVLVGIGIVILATLSTNVAGCSGSYPTFNATSQLCTNGTAQINPSTATTTINTVTGYLGTSSGGLASWIPIIIVLVIGMLFLGAFLSKKGSKS